MSTSGASETSLKRKRAAAERAAATSNSAVQSAVAQGQPASSQKSAEWKPEDILELLNYLKKNGWNGNWEVLAKAFPQHSIAFVQELFRKLGRSVLTQSEPAEEASENPAKTTEKRAPIEEWLELMLPSRALYANISGLPQMLELIAKYEKHPRPEDCGGVDYAAIYRYFAAIQRGTIPADLNPASARKVLEMLNCVVDTVRSNTDAFKSCVTENATTAGLAKAGKDYRNLDLKTRRREDFSEEEKRDIKVLLSGNIQEALEIFLNRSGFNPLAFPATYNANAFPPT